MTIVVEDGTGLATAESYISVAAASTYHSARGNSAWAALATDALREQALRRATDYMLQTYRGRWKGVRMTATQALDWPRASVYLEPVVSGANLEYPALVADDIVPVEVERACAELALRAAAGALLSDLTQGVVREIIGPFETEYDTASAPTVRYVAIDAILAPYMQRSAGVFRVVRT